MREIEKLILKKLKNGPAWANSFRHVKPVVNSMVKRGLLERVAPSGSKSRNMIQLAKGVKL